MHTTKCNPYARTIQFKSSVGSEMKCPLQRFVVQTIDTFTPKFAKTNTTAGFGSILNQMEEAGNNSDVIFRAVNITNPEGAFAPPSPKNVY